MIKLGTPARGAIVLAALLAALAACERREGTAENIGREVDKAAEKAGEKTDEAKEKLGRELEKAGEKMQDSAERDKK